ncbi:MAG: RAD55 family ATPase [Desulfurococcaceae archaeon]
MSTISRIEFDVDIFKYILPAGILRNSFIIIAGRGGTGKSLLVNSIVKSFIEKGEPVVYVDYDDDPGSILSYFEALGLNLDEAWSKGLFYLIDGFSFMIKGFKPQKPSFVVDEDDPRELDSTISKIIKVLDEKNIRNRGLLVIDSFNIYLNYHEASRVLELVWILRANTSKARGVLTITTLHTDTDYYKDFLDGIEHVVDGIILTENIEQHPFLQEYSIPLRQIMVKKMKGVPHRTGWTLYTIYDSKPLPVRIKKEESS